MKKLKAKTSLSLSYIGPEEDLGPLPALFYFALSAEESLCIDPFNQPVHHLAQFPVRIFSVDLPYHGSGFSSPDATAFWAQGFMEENHFLASFLDQLEESLIQLFSLPIIDITRVGALGLSRGGFIASHIAARMKEISLILAYAPLTKLSALKEFPPAFSSPQLQKLDLSLLSPILSQKKIKAFIGNRDTRVGTDCCFHWIRELTEAAYEQGIRSPQIEMVIKPSIGYMGHGTSFTTFIEGAEWIRQNLSL